MAVDLQSNLKPATETVYEYEEHRGLECLTATLCAQFYS